MLLFGMLFPNSGISNEIALFALFGKYLFFVLTDDVAHFARRGESPDTGSCRKAVSFSPMTSDNWRAGCFEIFSVMNI